MSKDRHFPDIAQISDSRSSIFMTSIGRRFEKSELGRMKKLLPLHAMAENFGLARKSMRTKLGRKSYVRPIVRGK